MRGVARLIAALSEGDLEKLADLAENYQPYVRALLGAILDSLGADTRQLRATLNGVTNWPADAPPTAGLPRSTAAWATLRGLLIITW